MSNRPSLGFAEVLDELDTKVKSTKQQPKRACMEQHVATAVARDAGFVSREPKRIRRRTGRTEQLNIKARADTIQAFHAIADANNWCLGETLEHAVDLLRCSETE